MAYSTPADVRKALLPFTTDGSRPSSSDPSRTAADLSDEQLQNAIAEADSTINSYLASTYSVPVENINSAVPHPIDFWSRGIAAYLATLTYLKGQNIDATNGIYLRFKEILDELKQVAAGKTQLEIPRQADGVTVRQGAGAPFNPYEGDLFTPDDFDLAQTSSTWDGWNDWRRGGHW